MLFCSASPSFSWDAFNAPAAMSTSPSRGFSGSLSVTLSHSAQRRRDLTPHACRWLRPGIAQLTYDASMAPTRLDLLKKFARVYDNLTDSAAKELSDQWFKLQDQRMSTRKKYFKRFEKEISTTTAARFFQVDNQIESLMDVQIASNLPLMERGLEEIQKK